MKISIIGTGYVGLCTGVGFAKLGHDVTCIDVDEDKIEKINKGKPPFFEENLENELKKVLNKKLKANTDTKLIKNSDVIFICVGTPSKKDGSIDLQYINEAAEEISDFAPDKYFVVVVKSTVVPKTTESIIPILEKNGKKVGKDFGLCMNPEFLKEGTALHDFLNPDRIVIGEYDKKSGDILEKLYSKFNVPIIRTNLRTAEMIKYAANAFLATKISLINEIGNICKKLGIDTYEVAKGIGYDKRISPYFLSAGCGFGGSCFKKDIFALINEAEKLGYEPKILKDTIDLNEEQKTKIVSILEEKIKTLKGKKIAVLGLAFKAGTDDIRDAPSIEIIKKLKEKGAKIFVYDPKAMENMMKIYRDINYCKNIGEALKNADACLILTDWEEFKKLSNKDFSKMKKKIIIEGRKVLGKKVKHEGVCW